MAAMITHLHRVIAAAPGGPDDDHENHPMRLVTREAAFEERNWSPERAGKVTESFDALAPQWEEMHPIEHRRPPLADAIERGGPFHGSRWLEVGSGAGSQSGWLRERCNTLIATDISLEMLKQAPTKPPRLRADASRLPLADGTVDVAVLVNALLFPSEMHRVLCSSGALVWVNTYGKHTPIYLSAEDVNAALGQDWDGVASEADWGTWAVLRRSR